MPRPRTRSPDRANRTVAPSWTAARRAPGAGDTFGLDAAGPLPIGREPRVRAALPRRRSTVGTRRQRSRAPRGRRGAAGAPARARAGHRLRYGSAGSVPGQARMGGDGGRRRHESATARPRASRVPGRAPDLVLPAQAGALAVLAAG